MHFDLVAVDFVDEVPQLSMDWIVGGPLLPAGLPQFWTNSTGGPRNSAAIDIKADARELDFGPPLTARVDCGNLTVLAPTPLSAGTFGLWANGSLRMDDLDHSGGLSDGDRLVLIAAGNTCTVRTELLYGAVSARVQLSS
jgi:hypothetical protein